MVFWHQNCMTLTLSAPLILHKGHVVQHEQPENRKYTLPKKTNIAPENRPSQKESSLKKKKSGAGAMLNFGGCILLPLRCAGVRNACWRKMSKSSTKESHLRQLWRYLWLFNDFHRVMALWDKTCLEFPSEFSQASDNDFCNSVLKHS